ncbi:endonuclease Q family protein [bacterium 210917-DFI.7.65]|nr:endonuclease Q family protein [bacterium 210917-DFI.7.65]MCB7513788.1 endonuclease Q family protein [bacterium 210917-SL.2.15]
MKKWLQNIMAGRYGSDELGFTLLLIYLGICIFGIFCDLPLVQLLGLAIILWAFFRILSRNIPARQAENAAYRRFLSKCSAARQARRSRRQDREHRYYRCRGCGAIMRVPRGAGKIEITCPKCGRKITKKA